MFASVRMQPVKRHKGYTILNLECCKCTRMRFHRQIVWYYCAP